MYLPLNSQNFKINDKVVCIENRFARTYDYKNKFRQFGDELVIGLTLQGEYEVIEIDGRRKKVSIINDNGSKIKVPYYRMGVLDEEDDSDDDWM